MSTGVNILRAQDNYVPDFISWLSCEHGTQLLRYLERMLGCKDAAQAIAHQTYARLYRLEQSNDAISPRALLFDVATKLATAWSRKPAAQASDVPIEKIARPDRHVLLDEAMQRLTH